MSTPRLVIEYNVQRLFRHGGQTAAARALGATASQGWTKRSYEAKLRAVASVLAAASGGPPPALLLLVEVEGAAVVADLCAAAGWPSLVNVVPVDEQVDGYDVAIAFDPAAFPGGLLAAESHTFTNRFATRDLLIATLGTANGTPLMVANTHWASRSLPEGEPLRYAAAAYCSNLLESVLKYPRQDLISSEGKARLPGRDALAQRWHTPVLVAGDFNDAPWDSTVRALLRSSADPNQASRSPRLPTGTSLRSVSYYLSQRVALYNPTWSLATASDARGTHNFDGQFTPLDQILVSGGLLSEQPPQYLEGSLRVHAPRSVPALDGKGDIQVRSGSGDPLGFDNRTLAGASDHLALIAQLALPDAGSPNSRVPTSVVSSRGAATDPGSGPV